MNLAELQSAYRSYLISGEPGGLADAVVEDSFDATERLRIYRNNFLIGNLPQGLFDFGDGYFRNFEDHIVETRMAGGRKTPNPHNAPAPLHHRRGELGILPFAIGHPHRHPNPLRRQTEHLLEAA